MVAGSIPGRTRTASLAIYDHVQAGRMDEASAKLNAYVQQNPGQADQAGRMIFADAYQKGYQQDDYGYAIRGFQLAKAIPGLSDGLTRQLNFWHGFSLYSQTFPQAGSHAVMIDTSGQVVAGRNFGNVELGRISGLVFDDIYGNGVFGGGGGGGGFGFGGAVGAGGVELRGAQLGSDNDPQSGRRPATTAGGPLRSRRAPHGVRRGRRGRRALPPGSGRPGRRRRAPASPAPARRRRARSGSGRPGSTG